MHPSIHLLLIHLVIIYKINLLPYPPCMTYPHFPDPSLTCMTPRGSVEMTYGEV